jgi:hypothetical protein
LAIVNVWISKTFQVYRGLTFQLNIARFSQQRLYLDFRLREAAWKKNVQNVPTAFVVRKKQINPPDERRNYID